MGDLPVTPGDRGRRRQEIRTYGTFTAQLEALSEWLVAEGVTDVVMEATGSYWKAPVRHEALLTVGDERIPPLGRRSGLLKLRAA